MLQYNIQKYRLGEIVCFELKINVNDIQQKKIKSIFNKTIKLKAKYDNSNITLVPIDEACGCSLIEGKVTSDNQLWILKEEYIASIIYVIKEIYEVSNKSIGVTAIFSGDNIQCTETPTIKNFISILKSGRLQNKTKYLLKKRII